MVALQVFVSYLGESIPRRELNRHHKNLQLSETYRAHGGEYKLRNAYIREPFQLALKPRSISLAHLQMAPPKISEPIRS